ncbi:DMT family transporter [Entomohabitans teleogrylli]|uniref:DMT family transporter n=1 Tax=Entomohabitans teleogrylli TaxID=1384589 RepID=UPI00073D4752|nr:DMT family transporter [Entomohabitans teleogrylli]
MEATRKGELLMLLTSLLAAAGWFVSRQAIEALPVSGFIGLRFLLAALVLLPFCWRDIAANFTLTARNGLLTGGLLGAGLLLWIYAVAVSPTLSEGGFITSLAMLFVPLLNWLFFRNRPPLAFWLGLPLVLAGLMLLSLQGSWNFASGHIWFAASSLLMSLFFIVNSRLAPHLPVLPFSCAQLLVVGVMGLLVSLATETWPERISAAGIGWLLVSVLPATVLRYVVQIAGQRLAAPVTAALIMLLEPVWVLLFSLLIYQEPFSPQKQLACALMFIGLLITRSRLFGRRNTLSKPLTNPEP